MIPIEELWQIFTMDWSKSIKVVDLATSMMFLYLSNNAKNCITHTLFYL